MTQNDNEKSKLINEISKRSNIFCDKIIDFLDKYNLNGLIEANVEQLKEYLDKEKDKEDEREV